MPDGVYRVLKGSGLLATIQPAVFIPDSYTLLVDDTPQSHVNLIDPGRLFFEYVQRMAHVIDVFRPPGEPLSAVHLGAGGLTLPRYIAHRRPDSIQLVIELERDLVAFVREHLPLPPGVNIRMRYGDARAVLATVPATVCGTVDVLIVDVFSGAHTPAHVSTVQFYTEAARLLVPDGLLLVNVMDVAGLEFARGQAATLSEAMPVVTALGNAQTIAMNDSGNIVLVGSRVPLPEHWVTRLQAEGPHPGIVLVDDALDEFISGAPIMADAEAGGAHG